MKSQTNQPKKKRPPRRGIGVRRCKFCQRRITITADAPHKVFCGVLENRGRKCSNAWFAELKYFEERSRKRREREVPEPLKELAGKPTAPEDIPLDLLENW